MRLSHRLVLCSSACTVNSRSLTGLSTLWQAEVVVKGEGEAKTVGTDVKGGQREPLKVCMAVAKTVKSNVSRLQIYIG
eukprot:1681488-Rhodomonas_salina.3